MSESKYYLSFDRLAGAITKGKLFSPNDVVDINNEIFENKELFYNFSDAHRSFAYLITSEYIHEQILPEAIKQAFVYNVNHSGINNNCNYINHFIDLNNIIRQAKQLVDDDQKDKSESR